MRAMTQIKGCQFLSALGHPIRQLPKIGRFRLTSKTPSKATQPRLAGRSAHSYLIEIIDGVIRLAWVFCGAAVC